MKKYLLSCLFLIVSFLVLSCGNKSTTILKPPPDPKVSRRDTTSSPLPENFDFLDLSKIYSVDGLPSITDHKQLNFSDTDSSVPDPDDDFVFEEVIPPSELGNKERTELNEDLKTVILRQKKFFLKDVHGRMIEYQGVGPLGEGANGITFIVRKLSDNKKYVVKILKTRQNRMNPAKMFFQSFSNELVEEMEFHRRLWLTAQKNAIKAWQMYYKDQLCVMVKDLVKGVLFVDIFRKDQFDENVEKALDEFFENISSLAPSNGQKRTIFKDHNLFNMILRNGNFIFFDGGIEAEIQANKKTVKNKNFNNFVSCMPYKDGLLSVDMKMKFKYKESDRKKFLPLSESTAKRLNAYIDNRLKN